MIYVLFVATVLLVVVLIAVSAVLESLGVPDVVALLIAAALFFLPLTIAAARIAWAALLLLVGLGRLAVRRARQTLTQPTTTERESAGSETR